MPTDKRRPDAPPIEQPSASETHSEHSAKRPVKRGAPRRFTKRALLKALAAAGGIRMQAAKILGVSPATITRAIARWPEAMKLERQAQDDILDVAIGHTRNAVAKGEPWAVKHVLRVFGQRRDWVEHREHTLTGPDGGPVQVAALAVNVTLDPESLKALSYDELERALSGDMTVIERLTQGDPTNGNGNN